MKDNPTPNRNTQSRLPHADSRARWQPPKLTFVEPTLTRQGDIKEITGYGFFGSYFPPEDGGS